MPGIGHLLLLFYSTTLKNISQPFSLDDQLIGLTEIRLPMQYIHVQSCTPTSARITKSALVAFADRTDIFIKYYAMLGSVVMENDCHFCENAATSKYYAKLILVVIEMTIISAKILLILNIMQYFFLLQKNDHHFCENFGISLNI